MGKLKHKNTLQIIQARNLLFLAAIMLLGVFAIYFLFLLPHKHTTKNNGNTYTKTGVVTLKETSCGGEKLQPDGSIKRFGGLCDGGNWLTIDAVRISTGGGALRAGPPDRIFDIDSIHPGERVVVRYVKDDDNSWTTNCDSCYVTLK